MKIKYNLYLMLIIDTNSSNINCRKLIKLDINILVLRANKTLLRYFGYFC